MLDPDIGEEKRDVRGRGDKDGGERIINSSIYFIVTREPIIYLSTIIRPLIIPAH